MALFLVVALKETEAVIESAITAKVSPDRLYKIEQGKWIIDSEAITAKDVSDQLGLIGITSHLVVGIQLPSGDFSYILEIVMNMQSSMGKLIEAVDSLKAQSARWGEVESHQPYHLRRRSCGDHFRGDYRIPGQQGCRCVHRQS